MKSSHNSIFYVQIIRAKPSNQKTITNTKTDINLNFELERCSALNEVGNAKQKPHQIKPRQDDCRHWQGRFWSGNDGLEPLSKLCAIRQRWK
jgi:hypothetical protein